MAETKRNIKKNNKKNNNEFAQKVKEQIVKQVIEENPQLTSEDIDEIKQSVEELPSTPIETITENDIQEELKNIIPDNIMEDDEEIKELVNIYQEVNNPEEKLNKFKTADTETVKKLAEEELQHITDIENKLQKQVENLAKKVSSTQKDLLSRRFGAYWNGLSDGYYEN